MGFARYIPAHEVDARHRDPVRTSPRELSPAPSRDPVPRNVQTVLDLGDVRFILFGGRTYACPPVPFKLGERVSVIYTRALTHAKKVAMTGDAQANHQYHKDLAVLARLLWKHYRPAKQWRRIFRRLGLLRNPFLRASEKELQALTDFFFQCRMMSSVRSLEATMDQ